MQNNNNYNLIQAMATAVNTQIQGIHAKIKAPKHENNNPRKFLKEIDKYLIKKRCLDKNQLMEVDELLEGQIKLWFKNKRDIIRDYEQFKVAFLEKFYSIPIKIDFKNKWANKKYKNDVSYQEYFYTQQNESRYLEPVITDYEVNFTIIRQMPDNVRASIASVDYGNSEGYKSV